MTDRPNVLFIMTDQHRWDYLGCAGASLFLRTPNIDRLAAEGMQFTHCVTNAPICSPARIGLAAGMQPWRVGSLDNQSYLPRSRTSMYERFRDHGYRVGCVGKLDLAKPDHYIGPGGDRPSVFTWGFTHPEVCEGKMHASMDLGCGPIGPYQAFLEKRGLLQTFREDYRRRGANGWIKNASHDSVLPTDAYEDSYIGERSARWIERVDDDYPWHLFVSFVGPHDPFDPPTEYADRYRHADMPPAIPAPEQGRVPALKNQQRNLSELEVVETRRQYCAEIELIDDQVGRILDALERRGMRENTMIVFTSDHGEMLGDHGCYTKQVAYEGSIRVPLIIAGPGVPVGQRSDALVELIDLNPTVCELAGIPPQEDIDAKSLVPVLNDPSAEHRADTMSVLRSFSCLRTRTHKLIDSYTDGIELYDLENDPEERRNIAEACPERVQELRRRLQQRFMEGTWRR